MSSARFVASATTVMVVALVAALMLALALAPAAGAARSCGSIAEPHGFFTVEATRVSCDFAREAAKRLVKSYREPAGWRCHYSYTSYSGGGKCTRRGAAKPTYFRFRRP